MSQRLPFNHDDPKWRCLCGGHVHTATSAVAIISIVLTCLGCALSAFMRSYYSLAWNVVLLSTTIYLLVSNRNRQAKGYVAWLACNGFELVLIILLVVFLVVVGVVSETRASGAQKDSSVLFLYAAVSIPPLLIRGFMFHVVYRGYKYLKAEAADQPPSVKA
ncbi:hypothetical protein M3Y99_00119700 [Aphelenchoides fujianensis]|nr:hypothetical protein M3Y99_00119700 [Aphelenchoides fujianensis]